MISLGSCPQTSLSHHLQTQCSVPFGQSKPGWDDSAPECAHFLPCVRTCLHCWNSLAQRWRMFSLFLHRWPVPTLTLTLSCPLPQRLLPWDSVGWALTTDASTHTTARPSASSPLPYNLREEFCSASASFQKFPQLHAFTCTSGG